MKMTMIAGEIAMEDSTVGAIEPTAMPRATVEFVVVYCVRNQRKKLLIK
jgi:hypothetical protein